MAKQFGTPSQMSTTSVSADPPLSSVHQGKRKRALFESCDSHALIGVDMHEITSQSVLPSFDSLHSTIESLGPRAPSLSSQPLVIGSKRKRDSKSDSSALPDAVHHLPHRQWTPSGVVRGPSLSTPPDLPQTDPSLYSECLIQPYPVSELTPAFLQSLVWPSDLAHVPPPAVLKGSNYVPVELRGCNACYGALDKGKLPALALANHNWMGPQPLELRELTMMEQIVCSRYRTCIYIFSLTGSAGSVCFSQQNPLYPHKTCSL